MSKYTTYGAVFIDVSFNKKGKRCWKPSFCILPGERKYGCESLSGFGHYYYHFDEKTKKEAFDILKSHMIKMHMERVKELYESVSKLMELEFEE